MRKPELKKYPYFIILVVLLYAGNVSGADQSVVEGVKSGFACGELDKCSYLQSSQFPRLNHVWDDFKTKLRGYFVLWPDLRIIQENCARRNTLKICPPPGLSIYISGELASMLDGFDQSTIALVLSHELAHAFEHYGASDPPQNYSRETGGEHALDVNSDFEMQADARGFFLMLLAGYGPPDFNRASENMKRMIGGRGPPPMLHIEERLSLMRRMIDTIRAIEGSFRVSVYLALMGEYASALRMLEMVEEQTLLDVSAGNDAGVASVSSARMELPETLLWKAIIDVEKNRECAGWVFGDSADIRRKLLLTGVPECRMIISTDFALGREGAGYRGAPESCGKSGPGTFSHAAFLIEKARWRGMNSIAADSNHACTKFYAGEAGVAEEELRAVLRGKEMSPQVRKVLEENLKMISLAKCLKSGGDSAVDERAGYCIKSVIGDGMSRLSRYNARTVKFLLGNDVEPPAVARGDYYMPVECKKGRAGYFNRQLMGGIDDIMLEKVGKCPTNYSLAAVFPKALQPGRNPGFWQCSSIDGTGISILSAIMPPVREEGLLEQHIVLVEHRFAGQKNLLKLDDWICSKGGPRMVIRVGENQNGSEVFSALFRGEEILITARDGIVEHVIVRVE